LPGRDSEQRLYRVSRALILTIVMRNIGAINAGGMNTVAQTPTQRDEFNGDWNDICFAKMAEASHMVVFGPLKTGSSRLFSWDEPDDTN